ncbi:hypothetical protein ACL6C3_11955 [Capilliphycus salinus ALCB114379]
MSEQPNLNPRLNMDGQASLSIGRSQVSQAAWTGCNSEHDYL